MTDREIMQQALEALELVMIDVKTTPNAYEAQRRAIAALRNAIEAAEKQEPVGQLQEDAFGRGQVMWFKKPADQSMLYTTPPAAPVQEPVAWANKDDLEKFDMRVRTNCDHHHTVPLYTHPAPAAPAQEPVAWRSWSDANGYGFWDTRQEAEVWCAHDAEPEPLYATPPAAQRQWVGLTNDEINEFAAGCHLGNSVQGAIYKAQAKLKEKNT